MKTNADYSEADYRYSLSTYARFPLAISHAAGSYVYDVEGNKYLDMSSGLSVCNLGHCHPEIVKTIKTQAEKVLHTSNYFMTAPQVNLMAFLAEKSELGKVFLANSGAEAVEGAYKIARKYAHLNNKGGGIIALENSFHGRTLATIATGKDRHKEGFGPLPSGFHKVPTGDIEALKATLSPRTAAVIIEPVQGEGGVIPLDKTYVRELRSLCDEQNISLIFDEIQCGMGRTGYFFAADYYGVKPDMITLSKALGGGLPISAILIKEKIAQCITPGDHGSTFGGNALACAAALKSVELLSDEVLLSEVSSKGEWLQNRLSQLMETHPCIREIRGRGLMIGVIMNKEVKPIVLHLLKKHNIIANATSENVLRLLPPLNITMKDLEYFIRSLEETLVEMGI